MPREDTSAILDTLQLDAVEQFAHTTQGLTIREHLAEKRKNVPVSETMFRILINASATGCRESLQAALNSRRQDDPDTKRKGVSVTQSIGDRSTLGAPHRYYTIASRIWAALNLNPKMKPTFARPMSFMQIHLSFRIQTTSQALQ